MILETAVALAIFRSCFDRLSTNGVSCGHPMGEALCEPFALSLSKGSQRFQTPTAVFRMIQRSGAGGGRSSPKMNDLESSQLTPMSK